MKIAKMGRYKLGEGLTESEMWYALSRLGFKVVYTTKTSKEFDLAYIEDPVSFIKKKYENHKYKNFVWEDGVWNDTKQNVSFDFYDTTIAKKILVSDEIEKIYNIDVVSVVNNYQSEDTLFIFWLNANVLYDRVSEEWSSWGHVVLCKGLRDWFFEIYDPDPYKKPDFIPQDKVIQAIEDLWDDYNVFVVRN